jgi:hypothetical protein
MLRRMKQAHHRSIICRATARFQDERVQDEGNKDAAAGLVLAHFDGNKYTYKLSWERELYMAPSCLSRAPILLSHTGMSLY